MTPERIDLITKIILGNFTEKDFLSVANTYARIAFFLDSESSRFALKSFGYSTKENVIHEQMIFSIYTPNKNLLVEICQNSGEDNSYEVCIYP